jgi:hypothetical protein
MMTDLELNIVKLTKDAKVVHMTQYLDTFDRYSVEFIQNTVRDLVNREAISMYQSPANHDWYYTTGLMTDQFLNNSQ